MFSVAVYIQASNVGVINEWWTGRKLGRKRSQPISRHYPRIHMEGLSQASHCPVQDLKQAPPKCKFETLLPEPIYLTSNLKSRISAQRISLVFFWIGSLLSEKAYGTNNKYGIIFFPSILAPKVLHTFFITKFSDMLLYVKEFQEWE
jgi:hypothetical protein